MRRLLAISLLMLFGLPFALPFLHASATRQNLPICCRRGGKHHCDMAGMMDSASESSTRTVREKCPYTVLQPQVMAPSFFSPSTAASVFAGITRHPAVVAQTEAQQRISFDRTRQKRGPPSRIA